MIAPAVGVTGEAPASELEHEFSLAEVVVRIVRGRWLLFGLTLLGLVIGLAAALLVKPYYQGEAVFLPPKNAENPTALIIGGNDPSDLYLGMLASRTVQDDVIDKLGLMRVFQAKDRMAARTQLGSMTRSAVSKNQLIVLDVRANDPELAAQIANAYLDALYRLNGTMVASASEHRRAFFETQLQDQKNALAAAEVALAETQKQTGISPGAEAQVGLNATAGLQSQIDAAEARLAGLRASETEQNPEVVTARSQLAQLQAELARQQSDAPGGRGRGLQTNGRLPQLSLEYTQKEREVKLRELVYNTLVQDYEKARLASIDPGPQFQIVDRAVVPERKAGPPRRLFAMGGLVGGFLLGLAILLLREPFARLLHFLRTVDRNEAKAARDRPVAG